MRLHPLPWSDSIQMLLYDCPLAYGVVYDGAGFKGFIFMDSLPERCDLRWFIDNDGISVKFYVNHETVCCIRVAGKLCKAI